MNISEFERNKPKKTMKTINDIIKKYQNYISEIDSVMDDSDAICLDIYNEVLNDLENIKKVFHSGL
jgi:hypothetical protein